MYVSNIDKALNAGMKNIKIVSQHRKCFNGKKTVEFFNVIADHPRYGKSEIVYQADFDSCVEWLDALGYDYKQIVLKQNRGCDIQIANRMFKIKEHTTDALVLIGRDGRMFTLRLEDMYADAPLTFFLPWSPVKGNTSHVKFGAAIRF